ncbi:MAG: glycosyltransferase family 9 protein [Marinicella sp.]
MTTNASSQLRSICIFRLSAIGDVTHVLPVIKTMLQKYPDLKITWVIGKLEHKLLKGLPGVEVIVFNKAAGWSAINQLRKQMSGRQFDVLLPMQLSFRANLISRFIPAVRRVGYDKTRSKELHTLVINERIPYKKDCHVLDGFMQFAEYLGCNEKIMDWTVPVSESDVAFAQNIIDKHKKTVIISPCSSHDLRNWSIERYALLIDQIVKDFDAQVILTGSPADKEMAFVHAIETSCEQSVQNLAGQDTLKQLLCLLAHADLVISPDSGPLHMAGSVKTPVIGLLAASNYARSGSYQYPELTVDKYPEACEKFLNKPLNQVKWGTKTEFPGAMDLIQVVDVMDKVKKVLSDQ